jgi:hypothetical protein
MRVLSVCMGEISKDKMKKFNEIMKNHKEMDDTSLIER